MNSKFRKNRTREGFLTGIANVIDKKRKYKDFFKYPESKAVVEDLCKRYYLAQPTIDKDPIITAFREGQRSVILDLLDNANINVYHLLNELHEKSVKQKVDKF